MSEIDEYEETIKDMISNMRKNLDGLDKKEISQRKKLLEAYEKDMKDIVKQIDGYEIETVEIKDPRISVKHTKIIEELRKSRAEVKKLLDVKKSELNSSQALFSGRIEEKKKAPEEATSTFTSQNSP